MREPGRAIRLLLGLVLAAATASAQPAADELPRPALDEMEPLVRGQLGEARRGLDRMLADPGAHDPALLAEALGRMGQLYHAYDLIEPAEACYRRAVGLAPGEHRWLYYLGLLEQREGRPEESIRTLERVLTIRPEDPAALLRLADQERALGRLDRPEEIYRRLLADNPTRAAALHGLAAIATARGELAEAARLYEQALEAQPSATRLHFLLGTTYRRLGELDKARLHLELAGGADVAFPDPLMTELSALASGAAASLQRGYYAAFSGDPGPALEEYRRAVAADPTNPEARRSLAGALRQAGDLAGAIAELRELVAIDPIPAGAHFMLAEALAESGAREEALDHLRRAVELAPDFRAFRLGLARNLAQLGRMDESASHLLELVAADPYDLVARVELGRVLIEAGDGAGAGEQFEAVLAGDATTRERAAAHDGLGRLAARAGTLDEARDRMKRAVRLAPEEPAYRLALANLDGFAGRYEEATEGYREVLERDPENEQARLGEATSLVLGGRLAEAVVSLEASLELLPDSADLADTLARILAAAPDEGLRDGERALAIAAGLFDRQPELQHAETLAMALAETGRFEEAVEWQERVVAAAEALGPEVLARARDALARYRRGEPWRLP